MSTNPRKSAGGWNQTVTDEQGRRRFHGAFTGGFSAGYFNTVGSKEGWAPSGFNPSREQSVQDFMDEHDDPLLGKQLLTSEKYDTMDEKSTIQQQRQQQQNAAGEGHLKMRTIIPGPVPSALLVSTENSIGKQLLKALGWRDGQGIGPLIRKKKPTQSERGTQSDEKTRDDFVYVTPKNTIQVSNFPKPRTKNFGVGFDPYVNAPEFRRRMMDEESANQRSKETTARITFQQSLSGALNRGNSRAALAYGLGALEDADDDVDIFGQESLEAYDSVAQLESGDKPLLKNEAEADSDSHLASARRKRVCSDGRPPLPKFIVAEKGTSGEPNPASETNIKVPANFRPNPACVRSSNKISRNPLYEKFRFTGDRLGGRRLLLSSSVSRVASKRGHMLGEGLNEHGAGVERKPIVAKRSDAAAMEFKNEISSALDSRFTSSSSITLQQEAQPESSASSSKKDQKEVTEKRVIRNEFPWQPEKLLCKRFNIRAPRAMDAETLRRKKRTRYEEELAALVPQPSTLSTDQTPNTTKIELAKEDESKDEWEETSSNPLEDRPPVDLFQAIFEASDDECVGEEESGGEEEKKDDNKGSVGSKISSDRPASVEKGTEAIRCAKPGEHDGKRGALHADLSLLTSLREKMGNEERASSSEERGSSSDSSDEKSNSRKSRKRKKSSTESKRSKSKKLRKEKESRDKHRSSRHSSSRRDKKKKKKRDR